jgi:predicted amidohydrolase
VGPDGNVLSVSRNHTDPSQASLNDTAPADLYTEFVDKAGEDHLFPVVETEHGRIACIVGSDILVPEIARCFAFQGAEVLLHLTADSTETWNMAKTLRAYENNCYVVSANCGGFYGSPFPAHLYQAGSHVIDFRGKTLNSCGGIGETIVAAPVDLEALRRFRSSTGNFNNLAELRTDLYAPFYARAQHLPLDTFAETPIEHRLDSPRKTAETIKRLQERGTFIPPRA